MTVKKDFRTTVPFTYKTESSDPRLHIVWENNLGEIWGTDSYLCHLLFEFKYFCKNNVTNTCFHFIMFKIYIFNYKPHP